ncbi:MAG: serine/threonine-protein kinase, partial [Halieaceae bacterium]|nr:serine/threonine-protein kinase [Halieaceae bacterium]
KIYPLPADRGARKRLLLEAQLVASIQSPKVVQIHDVIESREHLAMVMEYVPGCDLEEFLRAVRPSLASVLTIAADIAGALAAARQQHIVHGDLKAANVLIGAGGRVKLTDFGIARRPDAGNLSGGSLSALSPEQYLGKPLDERSDLFALGCLLYRMLGGVQPFVQEGRLDSRALLSLAPRPLEELVPADVELPPELLKLVNSLLEKEPGKRPSGTRVVRQILRRVSRGIPLAATNSLLQEARPCFRPESADDIPPAVPADLGREGRSTMPAAGPASAAARLLTLPRAWRWPAGIAGCAALAGLLYILQLPAAEMRVHIDAPVVRLAAGAQLPAEISGRWLVAEVSEAMRERLGPLRVSGPVGATPVTTLYADPARRQPQGPASEQLQLDLRCVDLLCVLAVTRNWQGRQANQQAVLFPDMSVQQWRDIVRTTTRALYP